MCLIHKGDQIKYHLKCMCREFVFHIKGICRAIMEGN